MARQDISSTTRVRSDTVITSKYDTSTVVQFQRKNEVVFIGDGLYPLASAKLFLGETEITGYCQVGNELVVQTNTAASIFRTGVPILNGTTNAYAKVLATSNNSIYLDQNYITVNLGNYKSTALTDTQFKYDDVVCQVTITKKTLQNTNAGTGTGVLVKGTNHWAGTYWDDYGNGLLSQYGVILYNGPANGLGLSLDHDYYTIFPKYWTREAYVYFPTTGIYQFTYEVDLLFSLWIDDVIKADSYYTGRWEGSFVTDYYTVSAGTHKIKFAMDNRPADYPQSLALIIRGPGTLNGTTFQHGNWKGTSWSSGSIEPVIFNALHYPTSYVEYDVVKTFVGRVQYYNKDKKVLVIRPEYGAFNSHPNEEGSVIRLVGKDGEPLAGSNANVVSIKTGNIFPPNSNVYEISISTGGAFSTVTSNTAKIVSHTHRSGLIRAYEKGGQNNTNPTPNVVLQSSVTDDVIGMTFNYMNSDLKWQSKTITDVVGAANNIIKLNGVITDVYSSSYYSIGKHTIDDEGVIAGMFISPESLSQKLTAGTYKITLTDTQNKQDQRTSASALYTTGTTKVVKSDQIKTVKTNLLGDTESRYKGWDVRGFDPVAQTFFVPGTQPAMYGETTALDGYWVSSVDLWFASKSSSLQKHPVHVRIVEVDNGVPTNNVLGECVLSWKDIKVTTNPYGSSTVAKVDETTTTKFKFKDPIYLEPDKNYAITIYCNVNTFSLWTAAYDQKIIGSKRIFH